MRLSLIVAMTRRGVIGRQGTLPWRLSADLKRFKSLTMGHNVIMGRKTYDSLPSSLPGRKLIVLTRTLSPAGISTATVVGDLDAALQLAAADDEAFIIGGGEIFRQSIDRVDRLYVTWVEAEVEGETAFPDFHPGDWQLAQSTPHAADDRNEYATTFRIYDRPPR